MNNDLISRKYVVRELLKEREHFPPMVAERYSFGVKLPHHFNQAMRGGIRKGLRIVETAPAVDVEPVRHGRWIQNKNVPSYHLCSHCRISQRMRESCNTYVLPYYCPNCGAKMDGDVNAAD